MDYIQAVILGIVEGLTEFLPISSTGHLTIAEKLLGLSTSDPGITGFTAVIQMGAIAAVILVPGQSQVKPAVATLVSRHAVRSSVSEEPLSQLAPVTKPVKLSP